MAAPYRLTTVPARHLSTRAPYRRGKPPRPAVWAHARAVLLEVAAAAAVIVIGWWSLSSLAAMLAALIAIPALAVAVYRLDLARSTARATGR